MKTSKTVSLNLKNFEPILVAVSGGADSMALLDILHQQGYQLIAASFDHQIRPDSASDVEFVRSFCEDRAIPFIAGSADVPSEATKKHLSLEEAARQTRYEFLFQTAQELGCRAIATGHTMDDQAETIVMHFVRGAGLAGLKGILPETTLVQFSHDIKLIRPLLDWRRVDTEEYCQKIGVTPREDSTNTDQTYPRNRIRADLIPALAEYNPAIVETLARNAMLLQEQHQLWTELVISHFEQALIMRRERSIAFSIEKLAQQPWIVVKEIIRRAAFSLKPGIRDVDFNALERVSLTRNTDLGGGIFSIIEKNILYVTFGEKGIPDDDYPQIDEMIDLKVGKNRLPNGWHVEIEQFKSPFELDQFKNGPVDQIWVEINPDSHLLLRPYKAGDRFVPVGMKNGSVKCSDIFINQKVPKRYRTRYPILEIEGEIIWLPLLRRSNKHLLQNNTRLAARIRIQKTNDE